MADSKPIPIRFTADDLRVIEAIKDRTGLALPSVVRLALRTLLDKLEAEKPAPRRIKKTS